MATTTGTSIWNKLTGSDSQSRYDENQTYQQQQQQQPQTLGGGQTQHPASTTAQKTAQLSRPTSPTRDVTGGTGITRGGSDPRSFTEKAYDYVSGDDHRREAYERKMNEPASGLDTRGVGGIKQEPYVKPSIGGLGGVSGGVGSGGTITSSGVGTSRGGTGTAAIDTHGHDQGEYCHKCVSTHSLLTATGNSFANISNLAQVHFLDQDQVGLGVSSSVEGGAQPVRVWVPAQNVDTEIPAKRVLVQLPARKVRVTIPGRYVTVESGPSVQVTNKPVIRLDDVENVGNGGGISSATGSYSDYHPSSSTSTNQHQGSGIDPRRTSAPAS